MPHQNRFGREPTTAPKNKCWIVGLDSDSFNYEPVLELISAVERHNKKKPKEKFKMYRTKGPAQKAADYLNSL
jgi:hypothetical protein